MTVPRSEETAGFTLIEVLVVLSVVAALAAILVPMTSNYIEDSRVQRARKDVRSIGDVMTDFQGGFGDFPIFRAGSNRTLADSTTFDILFGPGDLPDLGGSVDGTKWEPVDDGTLDDSETGDDADELGDQLIGNAPGYATAGKFRWEGPYLENLSPDPWGRAYLVNAENLRPAQDEAGYVLSAGPNGLVETPYEIDRTSGPITPGGDDILFRLR